MGIFFNPTDSTYGIIACNGEYRIKTTVTAIPLDVSHWIDETLRIHGHRPNNLIVGVDVECRPHGRYGTSGVNPAALLQLCVGDRCLIFQLLYCAYIPDKLSDFLSDDRFRLVGVGIKAYAQKLEIEYGLMMRGHVDDLRELAAEKSGQYHMRLYWLPDLVREVCGLWLNSMPAVSQSDWGRLELEEEQIEFATIRAFAAYQVGRRLLGENL